MPEISQQRVSELAMQASPHCGQPGQALMSAIRLGIREGLEVAAREVFPVWSLTGPEAARAIRAITIEGER